MKKKIKTAIPPVDPMTQYLFYLENNGAPISLTSDNDPINNKESLSFLHKPSTTKRQPCSSKAAKIAYNQGGPVSDNTNLPKGLDG